MTLSSELAGRSLRLPAPQTRDVQVVRDLRIPMDDGAVLLADRWLPVAGASGPAGARRSAGGDGAGGPPPVVLVRSPYGRRVRATRATPAPRSRSRPPRGSSRSRTSCCTTQSTRRR